MNITIIIIISLVIIYTIVDTLRGYSRKRWYKRGYVDACNDNDKYRLDDAYSEADESFESKYGQFYD